MLTTPTAHCISSPIPQSMGGKRKGIIVILHLHQVSRTRHLVSELRRRKKRRQGRQWVKTPEMGGYSRQITGHTHFTCEIVGNVTPM